MLARVKHLPAFFLLRDAMKLQNDSTTMKPLFLLALNLQNRGIIFLLLMPYPLFGLTTSRLFSGFSALTLCVYLRTKICDEAIKAQLLMKEHLTLEYCCLTCNLKARPFKHGTLFLRLLKVDNIQYSTY